MPLEAFDSFAYSGTIDSQRDAMRNPSSIIYENNIFLPDENDAEHDDNEEADVLAMQEVISVGNRISQDMLREVDEDIVRDLMAVAGQRNIPIEEIQHLAHKPRVRVLNEEEKERILFRQRINKMTDLERDIESRFGML